jgi:hypothetical protein
MSYKEVHDFYAEPKQRVPFLRARQAVEERNG